jgi:hypothetical protein
VLKTVFGRRLTFAELTGETVLPTDRKARQGRGRCRKPK